jgi:hypothetical protein
VVEDQRTSDQRQKPIGAPPTTPLTNRNPPDRNQTCAKDNYNARREWIRLGVEVLALVGLACYVHWTKVQSLATERAADAAKQSAKVAEDTLRLVESPDIELESIECSTPAFGLDTRLTLHYRNFGRTKAKGVRSVFSYSVRDAKDISQLPPPALTNASVGAVAPNAAYPSGTTGTVGGLLTIRFPTVAPVESLQRLRNGELVFEFWGVNDYQSMLGDHRQNTFNYVWDRVWPDKCVFTLVESH